MFKLILKIFVLFAVFGTLHAASISANLQFNTRCTTGITKHLTAAKTQYTRASASALYAKSAWVATWMTTMYQNVARFTSQVTQINNAYQSSNQYVASIAIRDRCSTIIEILTTAKSVVTEAQCSNASQLSSEIDSIIVIIKAFQSYIVQFTNYKPSLYVQAYRYMKVVTTDAQINNLGSAIIRASKSIESTMTAVANRVIKDTKFVQLAFSLDFRRYFWANNRAAMNTALVAQTTAYDAVVKTNTRAELAVLNTQYATFDAYTASIIVEFNGYAAYAQATFNTVINTIVRLYVSEATVQKVYVPLGQQILTNLAIAYIAINDQFLIAIEHCKARIDSQKSGQNGSQSSAASNYKDQSNNEGSYSLKGETKKCEARGRGLMIAMQEKYKQAAGVAICGGIRITQIESVVISHQNECAQCGAQLIIGFRAVLNQVKLEIQKSINKNLSALGNCARKAGSAEAGHSGETSNKCISSNMDVTFSKLKTKGISLVAQIKNGGKYIKEADTCRRNVRSSLVTELKAISSTFTTCTGIKI